MRRAIIGSAAAAALVVGGAPAATAAPPEREVIPLVCDNGETYDVVVNGNGTFTPGRIVGSTRVLVPISFGDFTFSAVGPGGEVFEEGSEPGEPKGKGNVSKRNPRPTVTCTFSLSQTLEQEEDGLPAGTVLTFSGSVTGFLTGRG